MKSTLNYFYVELNNEYNFFQCYENINLKKIVISFSINPCDINIHARQKTPTSLRSPWQGWVAFNRVIQVKIVYDEKSFIILYQRNGNQDYL